MDTNLWRVLGGLGAGFGGLALLSTRILDGQPLAIKLLALAAVAGGSVVLAYLLGRLIQGPPRPRS